MKARSIVVGYDGTDEARRALDVAAEHAASDSTVHVVTAYHDPGPAEVAHTLSELPEEFRDGYDPVAGPTWLQSDAGRILHAAGVHHAGHIVDGDPAQAILGVADAVAADLIVVGTRGQGRWQRLLRHSVSARVANRARASLMIVRREADESERTGDLVDAGR